MRWALGIEYAGSAYSGWQRQRACPSVQEHLETALSRVADHAVKLGCAGRTDAGVHALGQVVHFDTHAVRAERSWLLGANSHLPLDISVRWAKTVPPNFHARYSATGRQYRYVIYNHLARPSILRERVLWIGRDLEAESMHVAAQALVGEQDFSAYRAAECQSKTAIRVIQYIQVSRHGQYLYVDIRADAFLHHMVRNILGVLLKIGTGERPLAWAHEVLVSRQRSLAGITAPPQGLYMVGAFYPAEFSLPSPPTPLGFHA